MKIIQTLLLIFSAAFAGLAPTLCDQPGSNAAVCIYSSLQSVTQNTCLVYSQPGGTYCIRCQQGLYLTPGKLGQYCSSTPTLAAGAPVPDGTACSPTPYDQSIGAPISANYAIATKYNNTDQTKIQYCLDNNLPITGSIYCNSTNIKSFAKLTTTQQNWIATSIGCQQCKKTAVSQTTGLSIVIQPFIQYHPYLQTVVNDCVVSAQTNSSLVCPELFVLQNQTCQNCNQKLPMCLQCSDLFTCTVCAAGYNTVKLIDATGQVYTTCLMNTCGYDTSGQFGITPQCQYCTLLNCLQCSILNTNVFSAGSMQPQFAQTCTMCQPGYFLKTDVNGLNSCMAQIQTNIAIDMYVMSTDGNINVTPGITVDGTTLGTAYNFITQALNDIYTGVTVNSEMFSDVTVNVWIGKGIHHLLYCTNAVVTNVVSNACSQNLMTFQYPQTNNVQIYFKALDCSNNKWGQDPSFLTNCVNIQSGDKPQIRVASSYAYFNITNFGQFENLIFTAEDQLAIDQSATLCNYEAYPVQKCSFKSAPTAFINPLNLTTKFVVPNCYYTCGVQGYDPEAFLNLQNSQSCQADPTQGLQGISQCAGSPYNASFFQAVGEYYEKRHQVLFNLYSFDGLQSKQIIAPTLNLINCEFRYFLTNQESLINIEVENIQPSEQTDSVNVGPQGQQVNSNYYFFQGFDAGAQIQIINSNFHDSKFCKGLIVYRRQQSFSLSISDAIVNQTAFGSNVTKNLPSIQIISSTFYNLGLTDTLNTITVVGIQVPTQAVGPLSYPIFTNKGLILNLEQFQGSVEITGSTFSNNMINVPGIAYIPKTAPFQYLTQGLLQLQPQFFQNGQVSCIGSFLPMLDQTFDSVDFLESFNLIHLKGIINQTITLTSNVFLNNIALDGNVYIDALNSTLTFTQNKFIQNLCYLQANGAFIRNVANLMIFQNSFFGNSGFYQNRGGALFIQQSQNVTITQSGFDKNMVGYQGSAIYFKLCKNVQVTSNQFTGNGPIYSFLEKQYSPYYIFILKQLQTAVYFDPTFTCTDEFKFIDSCWDKTKQIQFAYVQGTIYMQGDTPNSQGNTTSTILVDSNFFYQNQVTQILQKSIQNQQQASSVFIKGAVNTQITNNKFMSHYSAYADQIKLSAPNTYSAQTYNYWLYSHAPLMYIETSQLTVSFNLFENNLNQQVNMIGALIQFRNTLFYKVDIKNYFFTNSSQSVGSDVFQTQSSNLIADQPNQMTFTYNNVQYNDYSGTSGSLIQIINGLALIQFNTIQYNGNFLWGQPAVGIINGSVIINQNTFMHQYCNSACISSFISSNTLVSNNYINFIIGTGFKVSKSDIYMQDQATNNTFNSIIELTNNSTANIFRCKLENAWGDYGTLISSSESTFQLAYSQIYLTVNIKNNTSPLISSYAGTKPQNLSISNSSLNNLSQIMNSLGVLWIRQTFNSYVFSSNFTNLIGDKAAILTSDDSEVAFTNIPPKSNSSVYNITQNNNSQSQNGSQFSNQSSTTQKSIEQTIKNSTQPNKSCSNSTCQSTQQDANLQSQNNAVAQEAISQAMKDITSQSKNTTQNTTQEIINSVKKPSTINSTFSLGNSTNVTLNKTAKNNLIANNTYSSPSRNLQANQQIQYQNIIKNCSSGNGTIIHASNSFLKFNNVQILDSKGQNSIIEGYQSNMIIQHSDFSSNNVTNNGLLNFQSCYNVTINNCSFQKNYGEYQDSILTAQQSKIYFDYSKFFNNWALSQTMFAGNGWLKFNNSIFDGNYGKVQTSGLTLSNSYCDIRNTIIQNSHSDTADSGFFRTLSLSRVRILDNTVIRNISGYWFGLFTGITNSTLIMDNNITITNISSQAGTSFMIRSSHEVRINQTYFSDHKQTIFDFKEVQVSISQSNFTKAKGNFIQATLSGLSLDKISIQDALGSDILGMGVYCKSCRDVTITNSQFKNIKTEGMSDTLYTFGGALYISAQNLLVDKCLFDQNYADAGGAIYLSNTTKTIIKNSIFTNNSAWPEYTGDGGAILFECANDKCETQIMNNSFIGNRAGGIGGALQYYSVNFTNVEQNNTFQGNEANQSADLGSFPGKLIISSPTINTTFYDSSLKNNNLQLNIVPGHKLVMVATVYDQENRPLSGENQATGKISFVDTKTNFTITEGSAVASKGVITMPYFAINMMPGTSSEIVYMISSLPYYNNDIEFLVKGVTFQVSSLSCAQGERFTNAMSCLPCDEGFYLFDVGSSTIQCKPCENEAICFGGSNTTPRPGYWRTDPFSNKYIDCLRPESCLGGNVTQPLTVCDVGYTGMLCSQCQKNYKRLGFFSCSKCYDLNTTIFFYIVAVFILVGTISLIVRSHLNHLNVQQPKLLVYYKILITQIQIMGIFAKLNFYWGKGSSGLLQAWEAIYQIPLTVIAPDCLIQNIFGFSNADDNKTRLIYWKIIACGLLPIIALGITSAFWVCFSLYTRDRKDIKDKIFVTMTVVMFIYYPTIVEQLFSALNCYKFTSSSRMMFDLSSECNTVTHISLISILVVPGLIFWMIVVPYLILKQFLQNKNLLYMLRNGDISRWDQEMIRLFKIQCGFLSAGFKQNEQNIEIFLIFKKILIVFIVQFAVLLTQTTRALTIILFLGISFAAHVKLQYYYNAHLNQFEAVCTLIQMITLFVGMCFGNSINVSVAAQVISFIVLFVVYTAQFIVFYVRFRVEIVKWILQNEWNGKLIVFFRTILFGRIDVKKFRNKYMNDDIEEQKTEEKQQISKVKRFENQFNRQITPIGDQSQDNLRQSEEVSELSRNTHGETIEIEVTALNSFRTVSTNPLTLKDIRIEDPQDFKQKDVGNSLELLPLPMPRAQNKQIASFRERKLNSNIKDEPKLLNGVLTERVPQSQDVTKRSQNQSSLSRDVSSAATQRVPASKFNQIEVVNGYGRQFTSTLVENRNQDNSPAHSVSATSFRQHQNFDYSNEIEFRFEERKVSKRGRREQDDDDILDEDPIGMLTSRQRQQPKPLLKTEKKNFDSTFGKDNLREGFSDSESESELSSSGSSSIAESSIEVKEFDRNIATHNKNVLESEGSSYQANAMLSQHFTTEGGKRETKPEMVPRLTLNEINHDGLKSEQSSVRSIEISNRSKMQQSNNKLKQDRRQQSMDMQQLGKDQKKVEGARKDNFISTQDAKMRQFAKRANHSGMSKATSLKVSDISNNTHQLHFTSENDDESEDQNKEKKPKK